tara:strand:- start:109 stop:1020 length:912 start_codon:yes stop_codon:yes gene_type:complete
MNDYTILGITKNDTHEIITQKYKKLALKYHPDRNLNNKLECEEKFKEISKAYYNIINNKSIHLDDHKYSKLYTKLNNVKEYFKNMKYETIINSVIDNVSNFNDFINEKNNNLEKCEDLYINANIELFDIYNGITKTLCLDRIRKCINCKGIGKIIKEKILETCNYCNGTKYANTEIKLEFNCRTKNIYFPKYSHHYNDKLPGDIIINVMAKSHDNYIIYNNYDLIYYYTITNNQFNEINLKFKHLDNKYYNFKITNPICNFNYKIKNLGLLYNDNSLERGNLYIILHNTTNTDNTSIELLINK